jgi:hypothetical protein
MLRVLWCSEEGIDVRFHRRTRRIHFRTLSSNEVNPRSRSPYVDINSSNNEIWSSFESVTFQDRLAVKFEVGEQWNGFVLDCTEAKIVMVCIMKSIMIIHTHQLEQAFMPLIDLAFLTRDDILLLLKEGDTNILVFGVFSVPENRVIIRCRLPFPEAPQEVYLLHGPATYYGSNSPASRARMLQPDLRHRIISLMYHHHSVQYSYCVVLQTGPFLNKCKELLNDSQGTETFEWSKWSPNVTSCIPRLSASPIGFRCTFGSYMLALGRPIRLINSCADEDCFLMLFDFNPIPIRRGYVENTQQDYYLRLVPGGNEWYTTPARSSWHTISSSLPYRVFMRRWRPYGEDLGLEANTIVIRSVW